MDKRLIYEAHALLSPPDIRKTPRELVAGARTTLDNLLEVWDTLPLAEIIDEPDATLTPTGKLAAIAMVELELAAALGAFDHEHRHNVLKEYSSVRDHLTNFVERELEKHRRS